MPLDALALAVQAPAQDAPRVDADPVAGEPGHQRRLVAYRLGVAPDLDAAHVPRLRRHDLVDDERHVAVRLDFVDLPGGAHPVPADLDRARRGVEAVPDRVVLRYPVRPDRREPAQHLGTEVGAFGIREWHTPSPTPGTGLRATGRTATVSRLDRTPHPPHLSRRTHAGTTGGNRYGQRAGARGGRDRGRPRGGSVAGPYRAGGIRPAPPERPGVLLAVDAARRRGLLRPAADRLRAAHGAGAGRRAGRIRPGRPAQRVQAARRWGGRDGRDRRRVRR